MSRGADLNRDGVVNAQDLAILLANWGREAVGFPDLGDDGEWTPRSAPCCVDLNCCHPNSCGCSGCPEMCDGGLPGCEPTSVTPCENEIPCTGEGCDDGDDGDGGDDGPEPPCEDCPDKPCENCPEPPDPKCDDCPEPPDDGGAVTLHFIRHAPVDPEDPDGEWEVEELDHLNISTFVTTQDIFFPDGWQDPDNFKIEARFANPKNTPPNGVIDLEALDPDGQPFGDNNPDRKLNSRPLVAVQEEPGVLRSSTWTRLVVDRFDRQAVPNQTLLIWTDPADSSVEILGQRVQASYTPPGGGNPVTKQILVGADVDTFKLRVHVISEGIPLGGPGDPVVNTNSVEERINTYVRQAYSQVNMKPEIVEIIEDVEPVQNMISIGHPYGTRAEAGDTFAITIESDRGGAPAIRWDISYAADAGDTPEQTANMIAQMIAAAAPSQGGDLGDRLAAQVFVNPPTFWGKHGDGINPGTDLGAADILLSDPGGGLVKVIEVVLSDPENQPQKAVAPRAPGGPLNSIVPGLLTIQRRGDYFSASVEQRALARNYSETNVNIVDVFVVNKVVVDGGGEQSGQATFPGARRADAHMLTPSAAPIANNVFINADSVRSSPQWMEPPFYRYAYGEHGVPYVLPHEIGHILLDAGHAGDITQLMRGGEPDNVNRVIASKRISRELVQFGVAGLTDGNQVVGVVTEDLDQGELMRSWPNHP